MNANNKFQVRQILSMCSCISLIQYLRVLILFTIVISSCMIEESFSFKFPSTMKTNLGDIRTRTQSTTTDLRMNFFDMLGVGDKVEDIDPESLPLEAPLCSVDSISADSRCFAIAERAISFTGEDFDVFLGGQRFSRVRGAMLHLPGKDKMSVWSKDNRKVAVMDRKLVAVTPTYDIYDGNNQKIGWLEKEVIALTDSFSFYTEGSGVGPFKIPPAFRISGDFIDRKFVMKSTSGKIVARVKKDGIFQFDAFNHYQVQVSSGMDAYLVIAIACAIDEEFDEEHKERERKAEEKEKGEGFPFFS
mmetsp:Transcript_9127/g.11786  ORF Transcript_9127/g.11786 Transcript_9127/m.11786 type:complete len:303 (+) Transcript_9127:321-1229(+)